MSDDTHVSNVRWMVHEFTELLSCKVDHDEMYKLKDLVSLDVGKCFKSGMNVNMLMFKVRIGNL